MVSPLISARPVAPLVPCQRWRRQRDTYRPAGELIDPRRYGVEVIGEAEARAFVVRHHYSRSYPAARFRVGLFRSRGGAERPELVGVAVFSVPMSQRVIPKWTGQAPAAGVELGRLVLLDDVEGNGETWFLSRAFQLLRAGLPGVRAVVSCSDPVARIAEDGTRTTPGHVGCIYQGLNGRHVGRTGRATLWIGPGCEVVSKRALSKLRHDDSGAGYAYAQLRALGAPARLPGETGKSYTARALADGPFYKFRHPGNLVYVWAIGGRGQRRQVARAFPAPLAYPKARNTVVPMTRTP